MNGTSITAASVTALYLFDVAEGIDLPSLPAALAAKTVAARFDDKTAGPPRVRYVQAPVVADGAALGLGVDGFSLRAKFYDYGVVSLMLTRPFAGSWAELVALGQTLVENELLEERATEVCHRIVAKGRGAFKGVRDTYLSEDYLVFAVNRLSEALSADDVVGRHGPEIAQLLRGERQPLSRDERDLVLSSRLSYLAEDVVVTAWNAAFLFDSEAGAATAVEILEFANSQLLELRYHDEALEAELTRLYAELQRPAWRRRFASRHHTRAALAVQSLVIEVNELTDRMENAVKFVGDPYAARLFGLVADRLALARWKRSVEEKLRTLDDIRRFAVEQAGISQANVLEAAILLILLLEFGLFFAGIMD